MSKGVQNLMTERGWVPGLEGALAEISVDERFPSSEVDEDEPDPSEPGQGGGPHAAVPFVDGKRRRGNRSGGHGAFHEADHPRTGNGQFANKGSHIESHVERAAAPGNSHKTTSLGLVSSANAAFVKRETGIDIAGYERRIESSDIRHVLRSHGDPTREAARGQAAVSKSDFGRIPSIIKSAHAVRAIGLPGGRKLQRLAYTATIDGHEYEYVEAIRPAGQIVALKAMRKKAR